MGSQRTKANLYRTGYRKTKAALQEQQRINAAIPTTLAVQNTMNSAQATVVPPKAFQPKAIRATTMLLNHRLCNNNRWPRSQILLHK